MEVPLRGDNRVGRVYKDLETLNRLIAEVITTARNPQPDEYPVTDDMVASVRFGLEMMVDDLNQVRSRVERQNRLNRYRAEMWRTAADKSLAENELIDRLLRNAGESLEVCRASFNTVSGQVLRRTAEWHAEPLVPSLGMTIPLGPVLPLLGQPLTLLDHSNMGPVVSTVLPETNMPDVLSQVESAVLIPVSIEGKPEGVINLEICRNAPVKHPWSEERQAVARELVQILTQTLTQRRMELSVIAARDDLGRRVRQRTADLETANKKLEVHLEEKEVLLKEIHHRVKNNLQTVSSLLALQSRQSDHAGTREMFRDCQNRIRAISLLHEKLYKSEDLAHIDFAPYVERIVNDLYYMYADRAGAVNRQVRIEGVPLGVDKAIPCGLILSELVSNAFKYAWPGAGGGTLSVEIHREDAGYLRMVISDDGAGLPGDVTVENSCSLGLQLVQTLTQQLEGDLTLDRQPGTTYTIRFPR